MYRKFSYVLLLILALTAFLAPAYSADLPKIGVILKSIESSMEIRSDAKGKVAMTQQKVEEGVKTMELIYYRRDKDNAFLMIITAPESDKGNGYLRVDENFWMYRRNTRTFQHINRDESIGGSDARGDDFENRKLSELYAPATAEKGGREIISEETLGSIPVYKFELKAIANDVDYPRKIYWVRRDNYLPLKEESYSSSNMLMQTAYYLKYTTLEGKFVPVKQMFIDEFEKGNKTVVELSGLSTEKLNDEIFTKAYLENLSK
ncbi:MAG: outer membrane lipoprotein-sorting protein [Elusimicrobiota bacterium]